VPDAGVIPLPRVGRDGVMHVLIELDPRRQAAPYHAHQTNEELLTVLDGALESRRRTASVKCPYRPRGGVPDGSNRGSPGIATSQIAPSDL
jgi:hypothetical protein